MKVGILTLRSGYHSPHYMKEAPSLIAAGHEVVIIAPCPEGDPGDPKVNYLRNDVVALSHDALPGRAAKLLALPRLFRLARAERCDAYQALEVPSLVVCAALRLFTGKPFVYDCREDYPLSLATNSGAGPLTPVLRWLFERFENLLARHSAHVFVVTPPLVERFTSLGRPSSLLVNLPRRDFAPEPKPRERDPTRPLEFVFAGYPDRRIAVKETILALDLLRRKGVHANATFLGASDDPDFDRECSELVKSLELTKRVRFVGPIPNREVPAYLLEADCGSMLYLPTPYLEIVHYPVKLFEYMACALPVVCSDFPNLATRVRENDCGILADPTDPGSIAGALERLHRDPEEADRLGRNGREALLREFSWETQEARYVRAFE